MRFQKAEKGPIVPFDASKITNAVLKAMSACGLPSEDMAKKVTRDVMKQIGETNKELVTFEEVQDLVERALMKRGLYDIAKAYILYREDHARARKAIKVRDKTKGKQDVTDASMLMVQSLSSSNVSSWDRNKITQKLVEVLGMDMLEASSVAKEVENHIIGSGMTEISSAFIRETVNSVLASRGYQGQLKDLAMYQLPREFIDNLMFTKSNENSNIVSNNPEAVSLAISETILRQYALDAVFSPDLRKAHMEGRIHIHDVSFPHRVYCSSHSIEYIKKYGLKGLENLNTESKPAKTASVLTGHLNTFLASMQANYAGALGLGYMNILYAPMVEGMTEKQLHQTAQELVFNGSQNAFSRGGQTLFLDFNIHTGVPKYLVNVPAIGPGGKYLAKYNINGGPWQEGATVALEETTDDGCWALKFQNPQRAEDFGICAKELKDGIWYADQPHFHVMRYGDYQEWAQKFAHALLDVWGEGDARGRIFEFPKCDFHVNSEAFTDPGQHEVYQHACKLAAKNGSTYFVFDRDSVSLASCCRLKVQITDMSMLSHPEHLRSVGFQNVTINIPQAAYRAARAGEKNLDGLFKQMDEAMDLAMKAHLQKKEHIAKLMKKGGPLWQLGKPACDGRPYLKLEDATYIIGMIGVNDAVQFLTGKQMHEDKDALDMGLKITGHMFLKSKEYTKQYGLQVKLEESPAESAARRLAKADLVFYRPEALTVYKGGDEDHAYYTNSIHMVADADIDLLERAELQAMFNSIIEAGAITHAFIGEQQPSWEAIDKLVRWVFLNTQSAQMTFSPEFTCCNTCGRMSRGLSPKCPICGSDDVVGETRIVGYFSKLSNFNLSKLAENRARDRGKYHVEEVQE